MLPIKDHNPSNKFPLVTIALILINIFVFFQELAAPNTEAFIETYALIPATVNFLNFNSLFPFIYSMFLHAGFVHIASNMWFLWIFGDNVEADWGHIKFLAVYLLSGIIAGLAQFLINPASPIPMLGASGAVAGVLGSYLVLHPKAKIETLIVMFGGFLTRVNIPAYIMLGYWFITQLFSGTASVAAGMQTTGGVAFFAHVGGFISGFVLSKIKKL
jgi:membrane associated rhomboid family serine protease